jgi:hypothetical protein
LLPSYLQNTYLAGLGTWDSLEKASTPSKARQR